MVLVLAVLLSCSPRPDAGSRFHFWAKYVSREARTAIALSATTNVEDEVEGLRRRLRISDRELEAILAEAKAEGSFSPSSIRDPVRRHPPRATPQSSAGTSRRERRRPGRARARRRLWQAGRCSDPCPWRSE